MACAVCKVGLGKHAAQAAKHLPWATPAVRRQLAAWKSQQLLIAKQHALAELLLHLQRGCRQAVWLPHLAQSAGARSIMKAATPNRSIALKLQGMDGRPELRTTVQKILEFEEYSMMLQYQPRYCRGRVTEQRCMLLGTAAWAGFGPMHSSCTRGRAREGMGAPVWPHPPCSTRISLPPTWTRISSGDSNSTSSKGLRGAAGET